MKISASADEEPEKKKRRSPLKRGKPHELPPFRLTIRDIEMLLDTYRYRVLDRPLYELLRFPHDATYTSKAPSAQCLKRLKRLFDHGYLYRAEQPQTRSDGAKPYVYWLDKRGAEVVAEQLGIPIEKLDWRPREYSVHYPFLDHLIATNTVRVAITLAAKREEIFLPVWKDERVLKREHQHDYVTITGPNGAEQQAAVIPDGYFVLSSGEKTKHFFLEVDRGTVTGESSQWGRRDWTRKIQAYIAYYGGANFRDRYQAEGLRILTVTTTDERLKHLKAITEGAGGKSRFFFATFEQMTKALVLTAPFCQVATKQEPLPLFPSPTHTS